MDGGDAAYLGENPQIIVNGFVKAGIAEALDSSIDCRPKEEENMSGELSDTEGYDSSVDDGSGVMARMVSYIVHSRYIGSVDS